MVRLGLAVALMGLFVLGGCAGLPGAGPIAADVAPLGGNPHEPLLNYAVADITTTVVNVLAGASPGSFHRSFGLGSAPLDPAIGIGDGVTVTIYEAGPGGLFAPPSPAEAPASGRAVIPEQIVGRDGLISIPYAGQIEAAGLRPAEVEAAIVQRLAGTANEPQAIVTVTRPVANSVSVSGEVGTGGVIPLSPKGDRVLDAISAVGGIRIPTHEAFVRLTRSGRTTTVAYDAILADPSENIYLRPRDLITVIRDPQTFTAFGATGINAVVPFEASRLTLEEAVAKVGGLEDFRADPRGVFLFRFEDYEIVSQIALAQTWPYGAGSIVPTVYRLDLRDPGAFFLARRFEVRDKDIIYVSNAPTTELGKFLDVLSGVIATGTAGARLFQ